MTDSDTLILLLPPARHAALAGNDAAWWRVRDGRMVESGTRIDWIDRREAGAESAAMVRIIAVARGGDLSLHRPDLPPLAPKQADAVAARLVGADHPAGADALHVAPAGGGLYVATPHAAMAAWRDWLDLRGIDAAAIVPLALALPSGPGAVRGQLADEAVVRLGDAALPDEPGVADLLAKDDGVAAVDADTLLATLAAPGDPPGNLATGRYAARRSDAFDARLLWRAAALAALFVLLSLAVPLMQWARLGWSASSRDAASVAAAEGLLSPVPPAEALTSALAARLAALGGDGARLSAPAAALVSALEPHQSVSVDQIGWRGDGVLSATLGAPRNEDINPVLITLQARGWRITARPRAATDGRALADITMRDAT